MKKLVSIMAMGVLLMGLVACSGDKKKKLRLKIL